MHTKEPKSQNPKTKKNAHGYHKTHKNRTQLSTYPTRLAVNQPQFLQPNSAHVNLFPTLRPYPTKPLLKTDQNGGVPLESHRRCAISWTRHHDSPPAEQHRTNPNQNRVTDQTLGWGHGGGRRKSEATGRGNTFVEAIGEEVELADGGDWWWRRREQGGTAVRDEREGERVAKFYCVLRELYTTWTRRTGHALRCPLLCACNCHWGRVALKNCDRFF
jgi:hypothetical protein